MKTFICWKVVILKWNNSTDRITARNSHIIDFITSDNERYRNKL